MRQKLLCALNGHVMGRATFDLAGYPYRGYACEKCGHEQLLLRPRQEATRGAREELAGSDYVLKDIRNGRAAPAGSHEESTRMKAAIGRAFEHGPDELAHHPEYIRVLYTGRQGGTD